MRKDVDWNIDDYIDSHQTSKSKRIRAVARVLRNKVRVNYTRFLAEMQFNGMRKKVAQEYLEVLKDLELIKCENEEVVWVGEKIINIKTKK